MSSPSDVTGRQGPAFRAHHPLDISDPVRDAGVAVLVDMERDDLAFWAVPDLELPAEEPEQPKPDTTLESGDHSAPPSHLAPDAI